MLCSNFFLPHLSCNRKHNIPEGIRNLKSDKGSAWVAERADTAIRKLHNTYQLFSSCCNWCFISCSICLTRVLTLNFVLRCLAMASAAYTLLCCPPVQPKLI